MRFAAIAIAVAVSTGLPAALTAQITTLPPPSYGTSYTVGTPVDSFEMRRLRDWQLTVNLLVPTAELEALLPVGYNLPLPHGDNASVAVEFVLQERLELRAPMEGFAAGSYGPVDEVLILTQATNGSGVLENVILENLRSTQDAVNLTNAIFGPGSARLASRLRLEIVAEPGGEVFHFKGEVVGGRLNIAAEGTFSPRGMATVRGRRLTAAFRYVDGSSQPSFANERSVLDGVSVDQGVLVASAIAFKRDKVQLRDGSLTVVRVDGGRIDRWQEIVQKLQ